MFEFAKNHHPTQLAWLSAPLGKEPVPICIYDRASECFDDNASRPFSRDTPEHMQEDMIPTLYSQSHAYLDDHQVSGSFM